MPMHVIDLWVPTIECAICKTVDLHRWGLAVDVTGQLVPDDYKGEWSGIPCCRWCYEAHQQGLLTEDTRYEWRDRRQVQERAMTAAFARE